MFQFYSMTRSKDGTTTRTRLLEAARDVIQEMSAHVDELVRDIETAKQRYAREASWSARSVG
jgi:hypothetical protein